MCEGKKLKIESHIARSVSLDNLRPLSNVKKAPKFIDDTATSGIYGGQIQNIPANESDDPLLRDLDNILRNKLKMGTESPVISRNSSLKNLGAVSNSNNQVFMKELGLNGDIATMNQNGFRNLDAADNDAGDDLSDEETGIEEDDDEFVNVDEIDGLVSTRLPEKFISKDHKNNENIDYNLPANRDFQKGIDKRVAELENGIASKTRPQLKIDWEFKDFYELANEIPDWFSVSDYNQLPQTKTNFAKQVPDTTRFAKDDSYADKIIDKLTSKLATDLVPNITALVYISMGNFGYSESMEEQLKLIRRNNILLTKNLRNIMDAFKIIAICCRDDNTNLKKQTVSLFYASTILYMVVNVCIELRDSNPIEVTKAIQVFDDAKMLQFLTHYIEYWRWNSRLSMRIRNIISLLFKLFLLQFGDMNLHKKVKENLYKFHGLKRTEKSSQKLSVSPLNFQAFKDDITSRFPNFDIDIKELPYPIDNSYSLSQFLEIPRSKAKSSLNSTLPVPETHLATPAPSPPMSPILTHFNEGIRTRKSFQTNMAYPYLYPSDEESDNVLSEKISTGLDSDQHENDVFVPHSIEEAASILTANLEIKLSIKQLWNERDLFMATERGWEKDEISEKYDYSIVQNSNNLEEINIMRRIDSYYEDCLPSFNSLIFVLCQILESNLNNIEYKESELPSGFTIESLTAQLEIVKAKETSLRASVGIFFLLLKWFKLNHVLKFEQFAVLLFDSGYVTTCSAVLGKYALVYVDKIFSQTISSSHTFWKVCSSFNPIYNKSYSMRGVQNNKINESMLVTLTYLLKVLRKVTGSKTHRLKILPLSMGALFKQYYSVFNLDIYHPILKIIKELTPFKNKRWKSEHMDLISGVFLYERLDLVDNWVTGKDISGELMDAYGQEIAMRALIQFYNFEHYDVSMEDLGYSRITKPGTNLLYKDSDI